MGWSALLSDEKLLLGRRCATNWYHPSFLKRAVSRVVWKARLVNTAGSWRIKACVCGAMGGLEMVIGARIDVSSLPQVRDVMSVASCVLHLVTVAPWRFFTF